MFLLLILLLFLVHSRTLRMSRQKYRKEHRNCDSMFSSSHVHALVKLHYIITISIFHFINNNKQTENTYFITFIYD